MLVENVYVRVNSADSGMAFASAKHLSNVLGVHRNLQQDGCSARYNKDKNVMFLFELNPKQKKWAEVS
jgi:hypothetical protein